jgi:hypothetical protein
VSGAGEALLKDRTTSKEIDALMERDRLNRDAVKIKGTVRLNVNPTSA